MPTKKHADNMINAKRRHIQEGLPPNYPKDIDSRDYWTKITIEQHSPHGIEKDTITLFIPHNRCDSYHVKDGEVMLMNEKGLMKLGAHRLMAWIAKNKFTPIRRIDG